MTTPIRDLFYEFLLFKDAIVGPNDIVTDFKSVLVSKPLLEFVRYWNSILKIDIKNLSWKDHEINLSVDHSKKEIEVTIIYDLSRSFSDENELEALINLIFDGYICILYVDWSKDEWSNV